MIYLFYFDFIQHTHILESPCNISISFVLVFTFFYFISFAWQDVSQEDIPIMLVGNKSDLRQNGVSCVPTSYGEKLAMVMSNEQPQTLVQVITINLSLVVSLQLTEKYKLMILSSPNRHTTLCSVRLVPKMAPTPWRQCYTWPGEKKEKTYLSQLNIQNGSLIWDYFHIS